MGKNIKEPIKRLEQTRKAREREKNSQEKYNERQNLEHEGYCNVEVVMIAVIFEVSPKEGHKEAYLEIAACLRPQLETLDGFISVERFQSLTRPNKILSLSF
jgi:hypothetical protein